MNKQRFSILFILLSFFCMPVIQAQDFEPIRFDNKPVHDKDIQKLSPIQILEDSLVYYADSMYYSAFPENKVEACYQFIRLLKGALNTPNSFSYPFPKLKENIVIMQSPDNAFRIYNWEIIKSDIEKRYYGAIQMSNGTFIPLIDVSDQIVRGLEDSIFMNSRWAGALYYNIIQKELGNDKVYFLLGWNGASMNSEKKIMEAFGFNSKGQAVFGAPMFNIIDRGNRKTPNRFIYEYQKGAKLSLNYEKETDQIIMDHCESQIGDPAKKFTYIPDGTYDGLRWDGNKWNMSENVVQIDIREQGNAPVEKPIK
ncbi:MAG: hypothetical protein IPF62_13845 [Bacteroidetes bacterium]|nr:hypothetical protein [Bacteroidota bacterium]HMT35234.1 hypothetical protein [Chitinophagaceae bacterium]MBK6819351.1 hypothetical protein [Bacteroidota bacterium]MBK7041993.1 hypothetical protein [Bacteroidota bacterium]MBK7588497.1 hypothetical protein [Bacteroidota bacterium]